jgi:hypothetical protein
MDENIQEVKVIREENTDDNKKTKDFLKKHIDINYTKEVGIIYKLGFLGSLVYFISNMDGLWSLFTGAFKSLLWPAYLVFELMKYLKL